MSNTILIIEDETPIAELLLYALKTDGFQVLHHTLGQQGLSVLRQQAIALVILDVGLPDISGFEMCRQLRTFSEVPVLFLTARSDEVDRIVGLEIGADDYVSKPFSPREVVARVRAILRRKPLLVTNNVTDVWFKVDLEAGRVWFVGELLTLTRYEYLLLTTLLQHPGRIYSRAQLMDAVWADALDTSDRTVDTHIKTLRSKLKLIAANYEPIQTHRGMGYSLQQGELV